MKKIFQLLLIALLCMSLCACKQKEVDKDDIIIIYTNDVHCGIDNAIGYAGLVAYKNKMQNQSKYVTLIDAGDALQGSSISSISTGEAMIECLNTVGYDILTIGNHDFDYGYKRLSELIQMSNAEYINANIAYTGNDSTNALNNLAKYKIIQYGDVKVAYFSVLTPHSKIETSPMNQKEDGEYVIDFLYGDSHENFYDNTQKIIDECIKQGANYVICLAHFGELDAYEPYSSTNLAENTSGIDVIIDAHSHNAMPTRYVLNKDIEEVIITSGATQMECIGQITISQDGNITTTNIYDYPTKDEETQKTLDLIESKYSKELSKTLFKNDVNLTIFDDAGVRVIRSQEMPIGDFITDAFRYAADADIAIFNGGGIRADIPTGNVSMNDILNCQPFGNIISAIEMTGQEIIDYLEYCSRFTKLNYSKDGKNICEYGSFMQVSGMKYTIDTSITSDVEVNEDDMLISVGEKRRISDVQVLNKDGEYEPIDVEKTYVVGGADYTLLEGGSGTETFLKDHNVILQDGGEDYKVIFTYISEVLNYDLSAYQTSQNRITIK